MINALLPLLVAAMSADPLDAPLASVPVPLEYQSCDYYSSSFTLGSTACAIAYGGVAILPFFGNSGLIIPKHGVIRIFDVTTGKVKQTLRGHVDEVCQVVLSATGKAAISADRQGAVILWDVVRGKSLERFRSNNGEPVALGISEAGDIVGIGRGRDLYLYNRGTKKTTKVTHIAQITKIAFSSDRRFVCAGGSDGSVKVWDLNTRTEQVTFHKHTAPILSLAVSPDSQHICSSSGDNTVRCWRLRTGQERFSYRGDGLIDRLHFSRDGQNVLCQSQSACCVLAIRLKRPIWQYSSAEGDMIESAGFSASERIIVILVQGRQLCFLKEVFGK